MQDIHTVLIVHNYLLCTPSGLWVMFEAMHHIIAGHMHLARVRVFLLLVILMQIYLKHQLLEAFYVTSAMTIRSL